MQDHPAPPELSDVAKPAGGHREGCFARALLIVVLVAGAVVALVLTAAGIALIFGLGWSAYRFLVVPIITLQGELIDLAQAPRLSMFGLWLILTAAIAFGLARLLARKMSGDSVVVVLLVSTACVFLALSLTSWVVAFVAHLVGM